MKLLTAINEVLPKLGERPVTSTDTRSPTLAVVIPQLEATLRNVLTRGWWFNEYSTTLYPDPEGFIAIPSTTLKIITERDKPGVQRGLRLFDVENQTEKWTGPVKATITTSVGFEDLPESVAQYILYSALVIIYATDIGLEEVVRVWSGMESDALARMEAEHLQYKRYSIRDSRRYRNLRSAMRG